MILLNVMTGLIIISPPFLTSHCFISSWLVIWTTSIQHVDSLVYHTCTWYRYPYSLSTTVWHPFLCGWIQTRINVFMRYLIVYHQWRGYVRVLISMIILSHTLLMTWNVVQQVWKWMRTILMKLIKHMTKRIFFQMIPNAPEYGILYENSSHYMDGLTEMLLKLCPM